MSFLTDSMLAFPPLVFLLAVVAAFSPTILTVMLALAVLAIPTFIRLSQSEHPRVRAARVRARGAGPG